MKIKIIKLTSKTVGLRILNENVEKMFNVMLAQVTKHQNLGCGLSNIKIILSKLH